MDQRPLSQFDALAKPLGEFAFAEFAGGQRLKCDDNFGVRTVESITVQAKEGQAHTRFGSFVAIDKWVVSGKAKGTACCQSCYVSFSVGGQILCSSHRAVEQARVANTFSPAKLRELLKVDGKRDVAFYPDPG